LFPSRENVLLSKFLRKSVQGSVNFQAIFFCILSNFDLTKTNFNYFLRMQQQIKIPSSSLCDLLLSKIYVCARSIIQTRMKEQDVRNT